MGIIGCVFGAGVLLSALICYSCVVVSARAERMEEEYWNRQKKQ